MARPPVAARLIKGSQQWTADQAAWLQARASSSGLGSVSAVARLIVQQAMDAERAQQAEAV